jgi:hypothetical protein
MFQVKYKLCKRATLTSHKEIYYLTIFNKEEVIKELNLYPVLIFYVETNSYTLYIDILVDKNKVSAHTKTNIDLYKDLTFEEVLKMMNEFYNITNTLLTTDEANIVQIMQLIIANWNEWN